MSWSERERLANRIDHLFKKADSIDDDELRSDLARYICVLASGYLEASCRDIFGNFAKKQSSPAVYRFVAQHLAQYYNLKTEKCIQLASSFDPDSRRKIEQHDEFERLKAAVDSIVANRNNIAHGRDTGISLATIRDYYKDAKRFIKLIMMIIDNN